MKIGFLWHCAYPWDVRLEKMIDALHSAGHQTAILCRGRQGSPPRDKSGELSIRRVTALTAAPGWIRKMATYPLFFNPLWAKALDRFIRDEQIDLLIVRDVPLGLLAARISRATGIPIILDMAENYPAALISYQNPMYKPLLVGDGWLPRAYERVCLTRMTHTFVVAEEQRARLERLGAKSDSITLVGNTPVSSFLRSAKCGGPETSDTVTDNQPSLLYVGFIDPHRGVETVVRAIPELLRDLPQLKLTLVGDGKARKGLIELVSHLGIQHAVSFPGWITFDQLPNYIRKSTICLIPHLESEHTNTTLPNKLFEYMAFSKPVIAADCKPIKRIIDETGCGVTFKSGDVLEFASKVKELIGSPAVREQGWRGRAAVESKYNWSIDRRVFLQTVERIATGTYGRIEEISDTVCHHG